MMEQVQAVMGPTGLGNTDAAASCDLLTAAIQHLRTSTPVAVVRTGCHLGWASA